MWDCDWKKVFSYFHYVRKNHGLNFVWLLIDIIKSSINYHSSFEDYFQLKFYEKDADEKSKFVTTGKLYEFHQAMNDEDYINIFRNKKLFYDRFDQYLGREYIGIQDIQFKEFKSWLKDKEYVFVKPCKGVSGKGIRLIEVKKHNKKDLFTSLLNKKDNYLVEEKINQHQRLHELNPASVNTLRIITVSTQTGKVNIIGTIIRIGVNNNVDNLTDGGIAASIDLETGFVNSPGIQVDVSSEAHVYHPSTNKKIKGFKIPHWSKTKNMVNELPSVVPEVRTVGWDIAIREDGPVLIEGNDNWGKFAWQIPHDKGKIDILEKYLD